MKIGRENRHQISNNNKENHQTLVPVLVLYTVQYMKTWNLFLFFCLSFISCLTSFNIKEKKIIFFFFLTLKVVGIGLQNMWL